MAQANRWWMAAMGAGVGVAALVVREVSAQRIAPRRDAFVRPRDGFRPTAAMDAGRSDATLDSAASAAEDARSDRPQSGSRCPSGMRLVEGDACINVDQRCLRWLDPDEQMRCEEFAPTVCYGRRRRRMSFCMDQYEWPNRRGEYPVVRVTWFDARRMCQQAGKRLCTEREWTFACEGEQASPYLYGLRRDNTACHFDNARLRPDRGRLANPATAADEYARLYAAAPSGQFDRCVSAFGINDLTGNVDEWTVNETGRPFQSALKGGWWGPIRARCRPATYSHNETFIYYQIGFRCCSDPERGDGG